MEPRSGIRMNDGFLNGVSDFFSLSARSTSKGVTIHMNSLLQYFHLALFSVFYFYFKFFTAFHKMELENFVESCLWSLMRVEIVN